MSKKSDENPESETRRPLREGAGSADVVSRVNAEFSELTGLSTEATSSLSRDDKGWVLNIEVVEIPRIPDTTSVLATYEIEADPDGHIAGYRRVRRYERGRTDPT